MTNCIVNDPGPIPSTCHSHTYFIRSILMLSSRIRGCIQKFPDSVNNEINNNKYKHSLGSNTKVYGGKTHQTDSQNSDTTAPSGRELYHLQFSLQTASPVTFWIRPPTCPSLKWRLSKRFHYQRSARISCLPLLNYTNLQNV
jgi:hypothetical protein